MDKILLVILFLIIICYFYGKNSPSQSEIQTLDYIKSQNDLGDFPRPQISRGFKQISKEIYKPLKQIGKLFPGYKDTQINRNTISDNGERVYLPDYFRKDRLSGNDSDTTELRYFTGNDEPDNSWTDVNVSQHPKFYTSDIKDELTDVGSFFDKNNQYNDKASLNTDVLVADKCYTDKKGVEFCEDNTRLQNIPPSLIVDVNKSYALNTIGSYKDKKETMNNVTFNTEDNIGIWSYSSDRTINGGTFYDHVFPSKKHNETNSGILKPIVGFSI